MVSLAEQYPGPFATLVLGDLGADVVQVERPAGGDPARAFPGHFTALGRGKRSVALDLKTAEGRAACRALVERADVLLEGFRPGVLARLGLDPAELTAAHPGLVVVSISGFGQEARTATGPPTTCRSRPWPGCSTPTRPRCPGSRWPTSRRGCSPRSRRSPGSPAARSAGGAGTTTSRCSTPC